MLRDVLSLRFALILLEVTALDQHSQYNGFKLSYPLILRTGRLGTDAKIVYWSKSRLIAKIHNFDSIIVKLCQND